MKKKQEKNKPVPIQDLIESFFKEHKQKKTTFQEKILANWNRILTQKASKHARPLLIKNNILIVLVTNSAWLHQLILKKIEILKKINKLSSKNQIIDIRFKIGR